MAKTVLIVDDSRMTLDIHSFSISSGGYTVRTVMGGFEALEIMSSNPVDLVLVDINMPGMDGYTLIKKIRADSVFGEIPIIIITTEAESKDQQKGFEVGANGYIVKPVSPEEMLAQIQLFIGEA